MKQLIVVAGPTAIGKTAYAIRLATQLHTEIVSCDSRQFYHELRIGVARPSPDELAAVPHHFIACRSVAQPFNVYDYEHQALDLIARLHQHHDSVVAVGGSGLYIDALIEGFARMPDPTAELRSQLQQMPIDQKRTLLQQLDPTYYQRVDRDNPVRLQRALEVSLTTGRPYSQVLSESAPSPRPFQTEIHLLTTDNATLRRRIDTRVDAMMHDGLLDEVRALLPYRHLNTLLTVGYRELFPVIEQHSPLDQAIDQIKLNTWHYARKQKTWMKKYLALPHTKTVAIESPSASPNLPL